MRRESMKVTHNDFLSMDAAQVAQVHPRHFHPGVDIIFVWTLGGRVKGQWVLCIHSSIAGGTWMRIWTMIKSFVDVSHPTIFPWVEVKCLSWPTIIPWVDIIFILQSNLSLMLSLSLSCLTISPWFIIIRPSNLSIGCGALAPGALHPSALHLTYKRSEEGTRTTVRWGRWGWGQG